MARTPGLSAALKFLASEPRTCGDGSCANAVAILSSASSALNQTVAANDRTQWLDDLRGGLSGAAPRPEALRGGSEKRAGWVIAEYTATD